jgi:hypothetical protein
VSRLGGLAWVVVGAGSIGCEALVDAGDFDIVRPPAWTEPACGECVMSRCSPAACEADAPCRSYAACLRACSHNDATCRTACLFSHWENTAAQRTFDACYRGTCTAACMSAAGYFPARDDCNECLLSKCSEELDACMLDRSCDASFACGAACADPQANPDCLMTCTDLAYPDHDSCLGTPPAATASGACRNGCRDACAFGTDWGCVRDYDWKVSSDVLRRAFRAVHYLGATTPYPGVEVRVCGAGDPLCASPYDRGVTDADGLACLDFPSVGVGFSGFLGTHDPESGQRTLFYVRHPVTHRVSGDEMILPTASEVASIGGLLGVELAPDRASIAAIAVDCTNAPAPGIVFSIDVDDPDMVAFYTRDDLPSLGASTTGDNGLGGFANVPVTRLPVTVSARIAGSEEIVASRTILLRAGALTIVSLTPRTE